MTLRDLEYQSRRRDHVALERLDRRLVQADQHRTVREEVLVELGFLPHHSRHPWHRWSKAVEHFVLHIPVVPILVPALLLEGVFWTSGMFYPLWKEFTLRGLIFPLLAAIAAYQNWRKSRINSTVDDALKRKDMANALIMNNPELLLPYVQSALHASINTWESESDLFLDTKIDMYIYNEIDNLEFVFDKSNHNLIDDLFVMRAIKIFIARNENRLFRLKAIGLLEKGRYNHDFQLAAERLILVAEWRQAHRL